MSYGVFQQYYSDNWTLEGDRSSTGFIGTTANGVMYLSMPFLFALFTRRWAHRRQAAALCGTVIACASFFLSSYSTSIGHLVATQGITSALGCALIYSPITLSLGEWYSASNRALAYGIVLSCKNVVGTSCPFLLRALIDTYGFRTALRAWTGIVGGMSIIAICMIPTHPSKLLAHETRARKIPWDFLRHRSIYFYSTAIIFQSSGYGIPQTYLSTYARDILLLSQTSGTLMLALFNAPGIIASSLFGWLSDYKRIALSAQVVSAIPPLACAVATFLFWGLTTVQGGIGLLVVFSVTFGFFAGGYSATWGGMLKQLEREAAERNEAIDPGMLYGLLNGVRGIGYAGGGFAGVGLLDAGMVTASTRFGYGTSYGSIILFTGITSLLGGWVVLWRWDLRRGVLLVSELARIVNRLHF
ncbi:monocarboxylate transporter 2 [Apiospora hydei]|uniref:Monocarboxylate transporter 2 n=1 Tax=Apiospora hydei TaxID=1337664 RepID=A0ABR1VYD1_9PEZI